jgi:hypothetical protein
MKQTWTDDFGQTITAHDPLLCAGQWCVLHNPSDHGMRGWPTYFRGDKSFLVERNCTHGVGHPDPDSLDYFIRSGATWMGVHGCDGCCTRY